VDQHFNPVASFVGEQVGAVGPALTKHLDDSRQSHVRPHDSLEDLTPWEYLAKYQQAESSNQRCN